MTKTTEMVNIDYVEVPSGRFVNMIDPDPTDIDVYDIGHKLAQLNRFGGSTDYPYSVAQHAVFVSERVKRQGHTPERQLLALHHDDPEAFLMDIPRPWKKRLGEVYKEMTETFERAITEALGLPRSFDSDHFVIKNADNFALLVEARNMLPSGGHRWDYLKTMDLPARIVTPDYFFGEIDWKVARDTFLLRHRELIRAIQ